MTLPNISYTGAVEYLVNSYFLYRQIQIPFDLHEYY
jgi:hypothetical protein